MKIFLCIALEVAELVSNIEKSQDCISKKKKWKIYESKKINSNVQKTIPVMWLKAQLNTNHVNEHSSVVLLKNF